MQKTGNFIISHLLYIETFPTKLQQQAHQSESIHHTTQSSESIKVSKFILFYQFIPYVHLRATLTPRTVCPSSLASMGSTSAKVTFLYSYISTCLTNATIEIKQEKQDDTLMP